MACMNTPAERDRAARINVENENLDHVGNGQAHRSEQEILHGLATDWITACPYCRSRSYHLHIKPLARGLLVGGRCERCGMWGLSQLQTQKPLSGQELVSLEMASSPHVPVESI